MRWGFWNPVKVRFGAGTFEEVAGLIGKRRYALVTYNQSIFNELAARLAKGQRVVGREIVSRAFSFLSPGGRREQRFTT